MRIYKPTDRITLEIEGGIKFIVSPLSFSQKQELMSLMMNARGDTSKVYEASLEVLRYAIKDVQGFTNEDDSPWVPDFDGGKITLESLGNILNAELCKPATNYISNFINNVPSELPEGVTIAKKKQD